MRRLAEMRPGQPTTPVHLRPVGERVPAGARGRLPPARAGARLEHLPRRLPDAAGGARTRSWTALPGDVPRPRAGHDPDGGRGGRARRRRHRRRSGWRSSSRSSATTSPSSSPSAPRSRPTRPDRRPDGTWRNNTEPAVHLRPVRPGLLDAGAGRLRPAGHGDGHLRLPHRPPAVLAGDRQHRPERGDPAVHRGAVRRPRAGDEPDAGRGRAAAAPRASSACSCCRMPHRWGGHTTEFFAIGTAVRPLRADHIIAKPQLVLPADRLKRAT